MSKRGASWNPLSFVGRERLNKSRTFPDLPTMKTKILALFLSLAFLPVFAADDPFDILIARVKFDDFKPFMIVSRYGEKGELVIGSDVALQNLEFFQGRRIVVITAPATGRGDFIELVYELLGKPVKDEKSGSIEQPVIRKRFFVPLDAKEKILTLDGKKTLTVQLSTTVSFGANRIQIDPKDALEGNQSE